jgi:hypothetical protein
VSSGFRLSWVLAPWSATDAGCPFFAPPRSISRPQQVGWRSPGPHRCRPQGSCPSRRFWLSHAARTNPCESAVRRGAPTLRGFVSPRSRPWSRPSELSLLEEPYPLSRASCFLAGSRSTCPTARHEPRDSRPLSPSRRPLAAAGPKARRTGRPGRRFPGVARTLRVTRCRARLCSALVSIRPGSPDTAAGTPASKPCSPRESVPFDDHHPGQGMNARSVLSWAFPRVNLPVSFPTSP